MTLYLPASGFIDLLDALALVHERELRPPHLLPAAASNRFEPTDYQRHLAARIWSRRLDATLITRFSPRVADLLAHPGFARCDRLVSCRALRADPARSTPQRTRPSWPLAAQAALRRTGDSWVPRISMGSSLCARGIRPADAAGQDPDHLVGDVCCGYTGDLRVIVGG